MNMQLFWYSGKICYSKALHVDYYLVLPIYTKNHIMLAEMELWDSFIGENYASYCQCSILNFAEIRPSKGIQVEPLYFSLLLDCFTKT